MSVTVHAVEQRSPGWVALRLGRLTGSRAADMLAQGRSKSAESVSQRNLRVQLMLERVTKRSHERGFVSAAMQDGIDREADATALYEALTGTLLQPVGFVSHDQAMVGVSPDGVVNEFEGIVEVKAPIAATHWEYLRTGVVPPDYLKQITHGLWVTGARWCDWMSYHPDFPETLQTKLVRVRRDEDAIKDYHIKAVAFLAEVDRDVEALRTMADLRGTVAASAVA